MYYHSVEEGSNPPKVITPIDANESSNSRKVFRYLTAGVFSVVFIAAISSSTTFNNSNSAAQFATITSASTSNFSIAVSANTPGYDEVTSLSMLPWDIVAEPYKSQELSITSFIVDDETITVDDTTHSVTWSMCEGTDDAFTLTGSAPTFQIEFVGVCDCSVSVVAASDTSTSYAYSFTMAAKYVRRELRTLSDSDRDTFLDALVQLYTLSDDEGQELYGDKFYSASYFSAKHLNGAGVSDCDHWHDGASILVKHMAFTLMVEQSLQSINSSIAMPYWEYGMDSYLYDNWEDSEIFSSDWFGEEPVNSDHAIQDGGRWQGIDVADGSSFAEGWSMAATASICPFENAYGHLRSPWNNNINTAIGRHNTTYGMTQYSSMPTCSTLQSCFESDSLADINGCVNGATHGPVHILIGGTWDYGDVFDDVEFARNPAALLFFKVLWRMGYTRCPTSCDDDDSCRCSVPDEYIEKYGAYAILEAANIIYPLEADLAAYDDDDEIYLKLLRAVEDPGVVGDMYSSAAAYDPTFWPLHGAAERLVDLKRLYISLGESATFDDTWAFTTYDKYSAAAYLNGICDWSNITDSYTDLTLPNCTMDVTCYGHYEDDILEFSGFTGDDDTYTNIEFFEFIHPWTESLPYTYDAFDFDYCSDEGYTFDPYATSSAKPRGPKDKDNKAAKKSSSTTATTTAASASAAAAASSTTSSSSSSTPSWASRGPDMKAKVKLAAAARKLTLAASPKVKKTIPKELVSRKIYPMATLQAASREL